VQRARSLSPAERIEIGGNSSGGAASEQLEECLRALGRYGVSAAAAAAASARPPRSSVEGELALLRALTDGWYPGWRSAWPNGVAEPPRALLRRGREWARALRGVTLLLKICVSRCEAARHRVAMRLSSRRTPAFARAWGDLAGLPRHPRAGEAAGGPVGGPRRAELEWHGGSCVVSFFPAAGSAERWHVRETGGVYQLA
jgi:hypothetical protein